MGKGFILRDAAGTAVGCMMQGLNTVHLSFKGAEEADEAALLMKDGTWQRRSVGKTAVWGDELRCAEGVVILRRGCILADSGGDARRKYEVAKNRAASAERPVKKEMKVPVKREEEHNEAIREDCPAAMPQRRWPPPPCFQSAVYRSGAWTQEKE